jgi:aryl-alcohol dehydrogenase-like predicted oxidoreductase
MQQTGLRTAQLGETGLEITRVGFGAWAIGGGGWEFGWGPQEDEASIQTIHRSRRHRSFRGLVAGWCTT